MANLDLFSEEEKREMRNKGRTYVYNSRTKQQMPLSINIIEDLEEHHIRYDILERVRSSITPIVLIQGSEDAQKLIKGSSMLLEANRSISWIQVQGGNHTFNSVHPFEGSTQPLEEAIQQTRISLDAWTSK